MYQLLWVNTKTVFKTFSTEEFAREFMDRIDPYGLFVEIRKA